MNTQFFIQVLDFIIKIVMLCFKNSSSELSQAIDLNLINFELNIIIYDIDSSHSKLRSPCLFFTIHEIIPTKMKTFILMSWYAASCNENLN